MKFIFYGAGRNAIKLYTFLKNNGYADSIDCFCDQRYQELDRVIDGKACIDYSLAKLRNAAFIVTVSENSYAYNEIIFELKQDEVPFYSINELFAFLFRDKSSEYYRDYCQYCCKDDMAIEYYELKRYLQTGSEGAINRSIKQKFVWFMPGFPFLKLVFGPLKGENDVVIIDSWSECLSVITQMDAESTHYFVFFQPWADRLIGIIDLLKKRFNRSRFIFYSYDTKVFRTISLNKYKCMFDDIFLYDKEEAEKVGVSYYPGLYDKPDIYVENSQKKYDLVWSGFPHGRLDKLIEVYDSASKNGITCHFVVVDDGTIKRVQRKNVEYVDKLSPEDSIRITMDGKCSLDLKHVDDSALTIRVYEAIACGMKVLTDNNAVFDCLYYDASMMQFFNDAKEIDYSFLKADGKAYCYKGEYRPINFLKYVECRY